jgi:hypothetical protein
VQSGEFANSKIIESLFLELTRLKTHDRSGKRRGCRNHCFSGLFFDMRYVGHGGLRPVHLVSMFADQSD